MLSGIKSCLIAGAISLVIIVIASVAAFGQAAQPVQIAANTAPAISQPAAEITPSTSALQSRIDAQQQEINKLTALVEKLEASLSPVASLRPMVPSASLGYLPDPAGSPSPAPAPAPPPAASGYTAPRELLPDIGHIGAELGFFVGGATNPYKDNTGFASGGYIDLPWKNVPAGKLSYEIMIGLQRSVTTQTSTSGVNVVVDAALNSYLGNVYNGGLGTSPTDYLTTPLPVTSVVQERSKILTVAPFELKYTVTKLGRFRPYVVGGLGGYVWIGSDNNTASFNANAALGSLATLPVGSSTLGATLNALLQGSQIGGLAPTSPQLAARGVPHGQGNVMFGGQIGGGAEFRITPKLSLGFDVRHNAMEGKDAGFNTFAFKQGLHW
jgi:opacity protein-like surface antigen